MGALPAGVGREARLSRLHLLVCKGFCREVSAVVAAEGFEDVSVTAFPSWCGMPPLQRDALVSAFPADLGAGDCVHVFGGACLRCLADPGQLPGNPKVHALDQCFELVAGKTFVRSLTAEGAWLLTPGWLATWKERVSAWGFDEAGAPEFFKESARSFVLLDTGLDPEAATHLEAFSLFAGLPARIVPVGADHLGLFLSRIVLEWRLESERQDRRAERASAAKQLADHAAALDLMGGFDRTMTERETVATFFDLFRSLFAPRELAWLPFHEGAPRELQLAAPPPTVDDAALVSQMTALTGDYAFTEDRDGFLLRIAYEKETVGILLVRALALPDNAARYLNLALTVARVFGLAVSNARIYQALADSREQMRRLNENLETRVLERTADLEAANRDLQGFSYMISHEMRASIARVEGFCALLAEQLPGEGTSPAARFLGRIEAASLRMREIVDGLLNLTRLSVDDLQVGDVDLSALAETYLEDQRAEGRAMPAETSIAPDLVARGDRRLLTICLSHLLDNALKFSSSAPLARVELGTVATPEGRAFFVKDNGCGFDPSQAPDLFRPFARARGSDPLEGPGLGLAAARRIVERHGGHIWAEAVPGRGATFFFTLPPTKETA